jgi:CRISPR-associated protein Csx3
MGKHYTVSADTTRDEGVVLKVGFAEPAQNDVLVAEVVEGVRALKLAGGKAVFINGPASLPVAVALSHELGHLFGAVYCFDPKMAGYVCAISHDPTVCVGGVVALA